MVTRAIVSLASILAFSSLLAAPAAASPAERRGDCVGGAGRWRLVVQQERPATLRVRFELRDAVAGQSWQLFLSDNGTGIYSATAVADDGELRIRTTTRDRSGRDRIAATAVNIDSGATCAGSVRF
jgi:hypothetical protein